MDDLDGLRADVRAKQRAYYGALDTYRAATEDAWAYVGPGERAVIRQAMLAAHAAYAAAQRLLHEALNERRDLRAGDADGRS